MTKKQSILSLLLSFLLVGAVSGLSALLTREGMKSYETIVKPPLSPPGIVFPIVWSILFALMAISAWMVLRALAQSYSIKGALCSEAMLLYFAQLDHKYVWNCWGLEHFGMLNWMKGAINYSDKIIVVSPKYAEEIKTIEGGNGLDWTLNHNAHKLVGILNGVDYSVYNPATDNAIAEKYDENHLEKKEINKKAVLEEFGMPYYEGQPLIAIVSRLVEQKGFDLFHPVCEQLKSLDAKFIILGTGAQQYEDLFRYLNATSSNIRARIEFAASLSQKIYAGADMFLMPSAFEPCGLGQLIALKYGTPPIVRATGGLENTVVGHPLEGATGFKFWNYDGWAMLDCIKYAIEVYKNKPEFQKIQKNAMEADFSWDLSAQKYLETYKGACRVV